jgi:DNA-binding NtrC family response regulator
MTQPVELTADIHEDQDTLIGRSRAMQQVYKDLARISPTPATVLIRGETGTGKELIARAIYQHGHRAHMPFVAVNCAAIPENLLESELFGHEKGAFTGATSLRIGRFEQAHNATLFLDEIGDMDTNLQTKLLRVLQEKTIQRVGGNDDIPVDVRIIAGTHRDLETMMARGEFRGDLFYRLNVAAIQIPPLRERPEDIPLLVEHFLARFGEAYGTGTPSITRETLNLLSAQSWPGNVRQLQNVVRKALLACRGYAIGETDVRALLETDPSAAMGGGGPATGLHSLARSLVDRAEREEINDAHARIIEAAERELLDEALDRARGNQAKAARWLGLSRLTLRTKLKAYGMHPKSRRK